MNRIYKVIWSKVKHQYVVVSELAHRDGKRSSAATKSSWRAMAAALMLTGALTAVPHVGYAVDGGVATEGNYIAVAVVTTTDLPGKFSGEWYNPNSNKFGNDYYWNGRRWTKCDDSRTFTVGNQSYTYNKVTVEGKTYWVRDGYTIEISHEKLYPGATSDVVIDAFKESGADDGDLLKSYQTLSTQGNITTATGYNIHDTNTGVYGGADNQGGTKTPSDFGYNLDLDHSGNYSTRVSSNGDNKDYPDQVNNFSDYFKPVEEVNGTYRYNGQVVGTSNLYVIDGQLGVFVDEQGEIYTGSVLGDSNEILMTAIDGSGDYISYWATKVTDPNATMGSYRISDYNADRLELKNDIKGAHGDDIKQINLVQNTDGNGGMIAFQRYGKYDENSDTYTGDYNVPGTITIQNTELSGTNGNDVKIQFGSINEKGENIPQFTVDAGSQVEANKADATATSGQLSTLTINGNTYGLPTGTTYSDGNGIAISDSHEISVDTVAEKDGGNLYFTDGKLNSRDYRLINGTEVIGGTEEAPVYGYKVNDDGTVELNVQDGTDETSKQTVTIADVASKSALDDVSKTLGGAVMYDKSGNTYNYGSVTLGKADNKYSYDSETHTATGGVTLTNVAYADVDGENSGSNAVNVDLLKDYVDENAAVYSDGSGIAISTDGKNTISVDIVENGNLFFNEKGELNSKDYRLVNGTTDLGEGKKGYKVKEDGTVELTVQDSADKDSKQTVTIADVASKSALDDVSKTLGGAVMYDKSGETYNYSSVTLGNADNQYGYDESDNPTGGVTLTNVAYAETGEGSDGSAAVNVDLLRDYVGENAAVYSGGNGIAISDSHEISVDTVAEKDGGNLYFTDGKLNSKDYRLINGTEVIGEKEEAPVYGYKVNDDGTVELTVQDGTDETSKQTVTIADVASKSALDDVSKTLGGAVMYDKTGETYNYSSVTLGNGENKYSYNNGNPTGGVTLTNVAYADVDGKNTGSNAVNVDLLKDYVGDYVDENGGGAWNLTTNGEVNTAVSVSKGDTVDFSGALSSTLNGEEHSNIVVNKTTTDGNTSVTFDLADELTLGLGDTLNSIYINGNTGLMTLTNAENGNNWITLDAKSRSITGLASDLDNENWNAFMDGASNVDFTRAATTSDLRQVAMHSVQYEVNDDGAIDYGNIVLGNGQADLYVYDGLNSRGGTRLSNVAYAVTDRTNEAYDGSAAVNVDLLNDTVADVTTTVKANEKHIATNVGEKPDVEGGQYSVKDGKITLAEVDGSGAMTGNAVVIDNVASASDLGDVTQIHDGLMNKDENGNSIDTSVVDAVNNLDDKVGDLKYNDVNGDSIQNGDDTTTAIGKLDNRIDGLETDISGAAEEAKKHNTVEAGSNIVVTTSQNANGGTEYKVSVAPNLKVDTVTASGNIDAGSFSTGDITINKDNSGVIDGLKNKEWTPDTVDYSDSGRAATEAQLSSAMSNTVQYDSSDKTSVTFNKGGDAVTIHNVAAGEVSATSTDAVNGSQLYLRDMAIVNNSNNIQMLSNSVNELDTRIDRVGAGAAALAALHPLDFDPDAKWDFAAGYGNYRGANAVAVGAYYRPNEDVMFSVGGSMGGGENMVNAGVSFKLGAGSSNVTTSRVAMAKEIKSMRDIVAKQDAQIQKLTAMVNALVGVQTETDSSMFPDVPENHWAYEAVEAMAKSGLVKGYPDGEFKGDRTMTRYEFAQIVYNAIQAGAEVDARLVEEFKPKLQFFHIATVAKDKDGNPTIERVRAN